MSTSTLITHCGAQEVSRGELCVIEAPPPTDTWFPLKHAGVSHGLDQSRRNRLFFLSPVAPNNIKDVGTSIEEPGVPLHQVERLQPIVCPLNANDVLLGQAAVALGYRSLSVKNLTQCSSEAIGGLICKRLKRQCLKARQQAGYLIGRQAWQRGKESSPSFLLIPRPGQSSLKKPSNRNVIILRH